MTGTEIEVLDPSLPVAASVRSPVGGLGYMREYVQLAEAIHRTEMVPQSLRGRPDAVLAVALAGYELGIGPMQALQSINIIKGRPSVSPELMRALVQAQGHTIIVQATDTEAKARCRRKEWPADLWTDYRWTLDDARRAGLLRGGDSSWEKFPRAMLSARVTSEACRIDFADVIAGMSYTPEEVEHFDPQTAGLSGAPTTTGPERVPTETIAALTVRISGIPEAAKATMKGEWRDAGIPPLERLTTDRLEEAEAMVARYEAPADPTSPSDPPQRPQDAPDCGAPTDSPDEPCVLPSGHTGSHAPAFPAEDPRDEEWWEAAQFPPSVVDAVEAQVKAIRGIDEVVAELQARDLPTAREDGVPLKAAEMRDALKVALAYEATAGPSEAKETPSDQSPF